MVRKILEIAKAYRSSGILDRFLALAGWSLFATAIEKGASLVVVFLLARLLGADTFGRLSLAQGLVNALQAFLLLGAGTFLFRHIPQVRSKGIGRTVEIVNLYLVVMLTITVALAGFAATNAGSLASSLLGVTGDSHGPKLLITWIMLAAFSNLFLTLMMALENGRAIAWSAAMTAGLTLILPLSGASLAGLDGAMAGFVGIETVRLLFLIVVYARFVAGQGGRLFKLPARSDFPLLFTFGLPVFLQSVLNQPILWLAQYLIKTFSPEGFSAVAVFALYNSILSLVLFLSGITNRAAMPIMSSLRSEGKKEESRRAAGHLAMVQAAVVLILSLPAGILAPYILARVGPEFVDKWPALMVLIAAGVVLAAQNVLGNFLLVIDRPYFVLATIIPWALILLGFAGLGGGAGLYALCAGFFLAALVRTALMAWAWYAEGTSSARNQADGG
jgi:O-antigen/teichoic acid export membrane protein